MDLQSLSFRLWNLKTGQQIHRCIGYLDYVDSFVVSADGQTLIINSTKPKITLWNLNTGQQVGTIDGQDEHCILRGLSTWSNFNHSLLVCSDGARSLSIWNLETGQLVQKLTKHTEEILCGTISPDGRILISSGQDRKIIVWDVDAGEELYTIHGHSDYITSVVFKSVKN